MTVSSPSDVTVIWSDSQLTKWRADGRSPCSYWLYSLHIYRVPLVRLRFMALVQANESLHPVRSHLTMKYCIYFLSATCSKFSKNVHARVICPFFCRHHMEYLRDRVRFSVHHLSPVNHPVVETNLQGDNYTRCNLQSISPLGWISKMASLYIYFSALKKGPFLFWLRK